MKKGMKCTSFDFVSAVHRDRVSPFLYCHLEVDGHIDIDRMKTAVQQSGKYVPEIFCTFDFRFYCFREAGFTADDVFIEKAQETAWEKQWDLSKNTQLKISIKHGEGTDKLTVGMSHVLSDGRGFLQYLYLLSALYNGSFSDREIKNCRNILPSLKHIRVRTPTQQTMQEMKRKQIKPLSLCPYPSADTLFSVTETLTKEEFTALHGKARRGKVSLNDVFLAAYARVIGKSQDIPVVVLPCPADLRNLWSGKPALTVANMTGLYRRLTVEVKPEYTFDMVLLQVHLEMKMQKERFRCLESLWKLEYAFRKLPLGLLEKIVRRQYPLLPVSYTNFGNIEEQLLRFGEHSVKNCYLTGTYRQWPDFQLSVSSFQNQCTLNCTVKGDSRTKEAAEDFLRQIKKELMLWSEEK